MEASEPSGFRRFLDLRIGFSASRMMLVRFDVPSSLRASSVDRALLGLESQTQIASAFSTMDPNKEA